MHLSTERLGCVTSLLVSIVLIVASGSSAQTPVAFDHLRTLTAPTTVGMDSPFLSRQRVVAADLFGSSHPEMVTLPLPFLFGSSQLEITNIDPMLPSSATISVVLPGPGSSIAVGDIDQDGDIDLVVGGPSIYVLRNIGGGGFSLTTIACLYPVLDVYLAELTNDGIVDIVRGQQIFVGDGSGGFPTSTTFSMSTSPGVTSLMPVIPGDFDGDGDTDLCIVYAGSASNGSGFVGRIRRRNASGSFTLLPPILLAPSAPLYTDPNGRAVPVELNNDGRMDFILISDEPLVPWWAYSKRLTVVLGAPGPSLTPLATTVVQGAYEYKVDIGDWNSDGFTDISYITESKDRIGLLLNDGTGRFVPAAGAGLIDPSAITSIVSVKSIDDDGDGADDLVIYDSTDQFLIYRNVSTAAAPLLSTLVSPSAGAFLVGVDPIGSTNFDYFRGRMMTTGLPTNVPLSGHFVQVNGIDPSGQPFARATLTDANGEFGFYLGTGYAGESTTVTLSTPEESHGLFTVFLDAELSVLSGQGQSVTGGSQLAQPIVIRLASPSGVPIPGIPIAFSGTFVSTSPASPATTAADGTISVSVVASPVFASGFLSATIPPHDNLSVPFQVCVNSISIVSGNQQFADLGEPLQDPLVVEVRDCNGVPQSGVTVTLQAFQITASMPSTIVTDAAGRASVAPTITSSGVPGNQRIRAIIPSGVVEFMIAAVRGLGVGVYPSLPPAPTTMWMTHFYSRGGIPRLLAVDLPLPSPGYVATPYGNIYTSVLAPSPTLAVLDGFGIFGSIDPGMMPTSSNWSQNFVLPFPPLNITLVAQMYAYDLFEIYPNDYVVTNPVWITL